MTLYINYLIAFAFTFFLTVLLTLGVKRLAFKFKVIDYPSLDRKIQKKPVPLLGGLAIFLSFFIVVFYYSYFTDWLIGQNILLKYIWALFIAGGLLMIGGLLDDRYNLKPFKQIIWPVLAVMVIIGGGIGIIKITNPFGGLIFLDSYQWILFWFQGLPYKVTLLADLFTLGWLMGMMYTTKFLDGLDGLVSGIGVIGAIIIFLLSTATKWWQPDTALLAIILAAACLGFLIFNWHPAKVFLGEGGSLFIGFMLGILAIIAGGKIATALLIMAIPILDVVWVIFRRLFWEGKSPFKTADKKHLHFRLLDIGLSPRQAVLFLYLLAAIFGSLTLFLQSKDKLIALSVVAGLMVILGVVLVMVYRRKMSKLKY